MNIEVEQRKDTLKEIKEGEVFKYKYDGYTYYCIKIENPFTEFNTVNLNTGALLQLPNAQCVTSVRARLVVEE